MRTDLLSQRGPGGLNTALLLSLLAHMLLLSITLGGQKFGLPGLSFPWKERRLGADDLQIQLAPARPTASPATPAEMTEAVLAAVDTPAVGHSEPAAPSIPPPTMAPAPPPEPVITAPKRPDVNLPIAPDAPPVRAPATAVARNTPAQASEIPLPRNANDAAQERALEQATLEHERQSAERLREAELLADAQREASRQAQLRQEAARQELERAEAARLEAARREAARQEQARQAQLEAERQTQLEAARQVAAKQEAARQEQTRQAQLDAARQEAIRQEAARRDAIAQESARQEAVKQDAARQERARKDQAQQERAEQEAKREERLRAIGKQLDAEAAQRDAASNSPSRSLLPTVGNLRRGWLFGRADPNNGLVLYAEAMSRKIEMNMTYDMVREAVKQPHAQPIVTVAIRADGSVEKVTFVVSSGVAALDEAIRKVVASQAPYPAFPPALARQYDVIEIRRTWIFDTAIRLQ